MLPKTVIAELILVCLGVAACRNTQTVAEQKPQENQSKRETTEQQRKNETENSQSNVMANVLQTKLQEIDELREINYDSADRVLSAAGEPTEEQSQKLSKLFNQMLNDKVTRVCLQQREGLEKERIRETINVLETDLNDDGLKDYVINNSACGGSANFPTFVYQSENNKTHKSIYLGDIGDVEVTKHKTNGFYDLITVASGGASISEVAIYKHRNGRYECVKCGIAKTVKTLDGEEQRQITEEKCSNSN